MPTLEHRPQLCRSGADLGPHQADALRFVNDLFTRVTGDLSEVITRVRDAHPAAAGENPAEHDLHTLAALLTLRQNESDRRLGPSPLRDGVHTALDAIRSGINLVRFLPLRDALKGLTDLSASMFEAAAALGLAAPEVQIRQYDPVLHGADGHLPARLSALADRLLIDESCERPQNGFARRVEAAEFRDMLAVPGARLFLLEHRGAEVGFFIVWTEPESFPPEQQEIVEAYRSRNPGRGARPGWVPIVGILPSERLSLHREGLPAYEVMMSALAQTCAVNGLDVLPGEVRVSAAPNVSRRSHLRFGSEPTGIVREHDGKRYEALALDAARAPLFANSRLLELMRDGPATEFRGSTLPDLRTVLSQRRYRDPASVRDGEMALPNGDLTDLGTLLDRELPRGIKWTVLPCSDGLAVQFRTSSLWFTVRQVVPNQDMWTCDFEEERYRISDFREAFRRFRHALERYAF